MVTTEDDLSEFVVRIQAAAGANLVSVLLYGSAARGQQDETYSDVNLLCVLGNASRASMDAVAPIAAWWTNIQGHRPAMFLTLPELTDSADVFAIETLDLKNAHRVLHGRDVMTSIEVPMNLHRVQLEHELRTLLLRLRQHYVLAGTDDENLKRVLAKSVSTALTLARHALIASGVSAPAEQRAVIAALEDSLGLDAAAIGAALDLREERRVEKETRTLYSAYMDCLGRIIEQVDRTSPKSQWRRVAVPETR